MVGLIAGIGPLSYHPYTYIFNDTAYRILKEFHFEPLCMFETAFPKMYVICKYHKVNEANNEALLPRIKPSCKINHSFIHRRRNQ